MGAFLTYALDESNILVHVDNVANGAKCACHCPHCNEPLHAKNSGEQREHHFAHVHKDYDFLQKSFDPNFSPPALVYDLLNADEIVFFGHSIGVNDRQYFKSFFKQQTTTDAPKRKTITIFTKDEKSK